MGYGRETYKRKPCKRQADELIYELYVQQDFSCYCMVRMPYLPKMYKRIDGGEECTVKPSSSLRNEFRYSICREISKACCYGLGSFLTRYISLSSRALDVFEHPSFIPFCYQLPTKNPIFSKVHVCGEDVGILTVQRLAFKILA